MSTIVSPLVEMISSKERTFRTTVRFVRRLEAPKTAKADAVTHISFRVNDPEQYQEIVKLCHLDVGASNFIKPNEQLKGFVVRMKPSIAFGGNDAVDAFFIAKEYYRITFKLADWTMETEDCDVDTGVYATLISAHQH